MVIGRLTGSSTSAGLPLSQHFSTPTFMSAKAGMYFDTASSSLSLPSSTSIIAATDVIGFDIEYRRKMVSAVIGNLVATSRTPKFSEYTGLPRCWISMMAPGILPVAISFLM